MIGLPPLTPAMRLGDGNPSDTASFAADTIAVAPDLDAAQTIHRRRALHDGIENAVALGDALGIPAVALATVLGCGPGPNPDADLLALGREWQASAERCDAARLALDAASQHCAEIPVSEALYLRPTDDMLLWRLSSEYQDTKRRWFAPGAIKVLRAMPDPHQRFEHRSPAPWNADETVVRIERRPVEAAVARKAEILTAYDAWVAATKAEEARSGVTAAEAEDEAVNKVNRDLRRRIMLMQARTIAGVLVKVRVTGWCMGSSAEIRELVDDSAGRGDHTGEQIALGAVADLVAMIERGAA